MHKLSTDEKGALIQQLPQAVVFVNKALEIVYVSDRWLTDFSQSRDEAIGASIISLLGISNSLWAKSIRSTFNNEVSNNGLENFKNHQGEEHWFEWKHNPWYDSKGGVVGTIIEFNHVTDSIFDNIKIEQFEELLKDSSENQKIGSWEYDALQDKFSYCGITAEILGTSEVVKSGFDSLLDYFKEGKVRKKFDDALHNAKEKGVAWNEKLEVISERGVAIPVETAGKPIFKDGEFLGLIGTIADISERLVIQEKNKTKEHVFKSIFNSSYQFTGILDLDGTFLEINDTALKFSEFSRQDIVNKKFWEAYWWKIPAKIEGALKLMIAKAASGELIRSELTVYDRKKRPVPVDFSLKPIRDDQNKVISILAEGRMIKEIVRTREELKMNERQFRALYELSPVGYVLSKLGNGLILDINPAFSDMTGFRKSETDDLRYSDLMRVDNSDWPPKFLDELKEYGTFGPIEQTLFRKNGTSYPALISGSIITNYRNKKFLWTVVQDLSEIKFIDGQLEEERLLLRTLIDNLPMNVFAKDRNSRKILVNKGEVKFSGFNEESEVLGKTDYDLFPEETARISEQEDINIMENEESMIRKETIHEKDDGTMTHFITSKVPLKDKKGRVTGLIGMSMDITELKRKEKELSDLIEITSDQNKKLTTFAHIVSHDLRSHTANFSMLLDFLTNENDVDERQRIITMLTDASDNLLDTLRSLNEVVEINTNINVEKIRINLYDRINIAAQNLGGLIKQSKTKINIDLPDTTTVRAIPAYLDSILVNFITNTIKYKHPNRDPEIFLSVEAEDDYVVMSIRDNGRGIDLEQYGSKIFGMYKTFHNNTDARGIGLYLTKNQIEAMNGKVTVESEVGTGSLFKVYFNEKD